MNYLFVTFVFPLLVAILAELFGYWLNQRGK